MVAKSETGPPLRNYGIIGFPNAKTKRFGFIPMVSFRGNRFRNHPLWRDLRSQILTLDIPTKIWDMRRAMRGDGTRGLGPHPSSGCLLNENELRR